MCSVKLLLVVVNSINVVFINLPEAAYTADLINNAGRKVHSELMHDRGTTQQPIKIKGALQAGIYKLQVTAGDKVENIAVLVQ
ncbi:MAG: hypothetical protein JWR18_2206 [Segetibacter sp.]|jgi:hypothetical protein|nr:hypothetical protein [Segetibacter sp.]